MYFYYQINYSSTAVLEGQWLAITPNLFGQTPVRLILQKSDNKLERKTGKRHLPGWCFKKLTKHWREEKKMHTQQVQNTARVRSCLDMTIVNSLIVSLSLCPFAFSSFCLFVFLYFRLFVSHHSDQMSKGSHVYLCANSKVAVTDPVCKGRDIELLKYISHLDAGGILHPSVCKPPFTSWLAGGLRDHGEREEWVSQPWDPWGALLSDPVCPVYLFDPDMQK